MYFVIKMVDIIFADYPVPSAGFFMYNCFLIFFKVGHIH